MITVLQVLKGSTGDEIYMHYHQSDYLIAALKNNGFELIEEQRKSISANDGSGYG